MNWYIPIKYAQIWQTSNDREIQWDIGEDGDIGNSFVFALERLYELEYKYSMIKRSLSQEEIENPFDFTNPIRFSGMKRRKENILKRLEEELKKTIAFVAKPIIKTFKKWLDNHAILDPIQWAKQRIITEEDTPMSIDEAVDAMLYEYFHYASANYPGIFGFNATSSKTYVLPVFIRELSKKIYQMPLLSQYFAEIKKEMIKNAEQEAQDQLYNNKRKPTKNQITQKEKELIENYNNLELEEYIQEYYGLNYFNEFIDGSKNLGFNPMEIIAEIYAAMVFPQWIARWEQKGIKQIRQNIENIYKQLQSIDSMSVESASAIINQALNSIHVNGPMMDYLEQDLNLYDLKDFLNELSNSSEIKYWDKDLRDIGVII